MQFKSWFVGCIYSVLAAVDLNLRYILNTEKRMVVLEGGNRKMKEKEKPQGPLCLERSLGWLWKDGGWEKEGQARPSPSWKRELAAPPLWVSASWTLSLGLSLPSFLVGRAGSCGFGDLKLPHISQNQAVPAFLQLGGWRRVVYPCQSHQRRTTTSPLRAVATWVDTGSGPGELCGGPKWWLRQLHREPGFVAKTSPWSTWKQTVVLINQI